MRVGGEEGGEVTQLAVRARGLKGEDIEAGRVAAELLIEKGEGIGWREREREGEK